MNNKKTDIYLYLCIPERISFQPIQQTLKEKIKTYIKKTIDIIYFILRKKTIFSSYVYENVVNTNIGDIAIGQAIKKLLLAERPNLNIIEIAWDEIQTYKNLNPKTPIIFGGSGALHLQDTGILNNFMTKNIKFLLTLKNPIICYSLGVNYLGLSKENYQTAHISKDSASLLGALIKKSVFFSVRDSYSAELLKKNLSKTLQKKIITAIDPAYFLYTPLKPKTSNMNELKIGLNFGYHSDFMRSIFNKNNQTYITFLKEIQKKYKCTFYYFVHSEEENAIITFLKLSGIHLITIKDKPPAIIKRYEDLDLHICELMHSAILATSVYVPTINLSYDLKSYGFFKNLQLEKYVIDSQSINVDQLNNIFSNLLKDKEKIKQDLFDKKKYLSKNNELFTRQILDAINSPHQPN